MRSRAVEWRDRAVVAAKALVSAPDAPVRVQPPAAQSPARPELRGIARYAPWLAPSVADCIFALWAIALPVLYSDRLLNSDGDLPRHLRIGSEILRNGLLTRYPFSFTRPDAPFVPFEWLSEVVFAGAYAMGGLAAVAILSGLLIGATYGLLVRILCRRGADPLLACVVAMTAAILGSVHWVARPHLFTGLAVVILLAALEPGRRARPWSMLPFFAVWANLHGGFVFGFVLIALYLAGDVAGALAGGAARREALSAARYHGAMMTWAVAGSLLTPFGPRVLLHVVGQLQPSYIMTRTEEFLSPDFHAVTGKVFLSVLLGTFAALALTRRPTLGRLFVILTMVAFSLLAQRNIALFGITAVPLLALHLDDGWRRLRLRPLVHVRTVIRNGEAAAASGILSGGVAAIMLLPALSHGRMMGRQVVANEFDPAAFPVAAVREARAASVGGRIFNLHTWGGYLLSAWPEQKVFIDGGTDFYGDAIALDYVQVDGLQPGWRKVLDRWNISVVLYPTGSSLVAELERDPRWRRWYADPVATVLVRRSPGPGAGASALLRAAPRVSPGTPATRE